MKLAEINGGLSMPERLAVTKPLEKKNTDKRYIKTGGLFLYSMLIQKYYLKPLLQNLNLFYLLLCLQIKPCMCKKGASVKVTDWLISDIMGIFSKENIPGSLVTMDFKKA